MFDIEKLKLKPSEFNTVVEREQIGVPVKKPNKQTFIRKHPGEEYSLMVALLHLKEEGEFYLVSPEIREQLLSEVVYVELCLCVDRFGNYFLVPMKLPDGNGRIDNWNATLTHSLKLAESKWLRISANRSLGGYEVFKAVGDLGDPVFPNRTMGELVTAAFKDFYIESEDHPIIKKLRGV